MHQHTLLVSENFRCSERPRRRMAYSLLVFAFLFVSLLFVMPNTPWLGSVFVAGMTLVILVPCGCLAIYESRLRPDSGLLGTEIGTVIRWASRLAARGGHANACVVDAVIDRKHWFGLALTLEEGVELVADCKRRGLDVQWSKIEDRGMGVFPVTEGGAWEVVGFIVLIVFLGGWGAFLLF